MSNRKARKLRKMAGLKPNSGRVYLDLQLQMTPERVSVLRINHPESPRSIYQRLKRARG